MAKAHGFLHAFAANVPAFIELVARDIASCLGGLVESEPGAEVGAYYDGP